MKYQVISRFYDKQDESKYVYNVGDVFPREGQEVTEERIKELSTDKNALKRPLIELIKTEEVKEEKEDDLAKDEENAKPKSRKTKKGD